MASRDNPDFRQASFAGGEISPSMYGRSDFKQYKSSLKKCENWIVSQTGALVNRPGTEFVAEALSNGAPVRLVPFIFSNAQAIVMEFGPGYIAFYQNGQPIVVGGARVTVPTSYAAADLFRLKFAQSGDVVTICHPKYLPIDLSRLTFDGTQWSITNPLLGALGQFARCPLGVAFVNTNSHAQLGVPNTASGTNAARWSYAVTAVHSDGLESLPIATIDATFDRTAGGANRPTFKWSMDPMSGKRPAYFNIYCGRSGVYGLIDSVSASSRKGSTWYYTDANATIDFALNPPTCKLPYRWAAVSYQAGKYFVAGDRVLVGGKYYRATQAGTALGGLTNAETSTYHDGVDPGYPSAGTVVAPGDLYTFNGAVFQCFSGGTVAADDPDNVFGALVTASTGSYAQIINSVSWAWFAPGGFVTWELDPYQGALDYPAVPMYNGQRKIFANVASDPTKLMASRVGAYRDFNSNTAPLADDAVSASIASNRYEEIRSFVELKVLLALTSEKAWVVSGPSGGKLTPDVTAQPNNVRGSSWLDPLVVGVTGLYVQALGTQIWELVFDFYTQSYLGNDVTLLAQHLFEDRQIIDWAYAPVPYNLIWAVRDDGKLLGFTYVREQEVKAWHRHSTQGNFWTVCCVPETRDGISESAVYVAVNRVKGDGTAHVYIERFATRVLPVASYDVNGLPIVDTRRNVFLDAAVRGTGYVILGLAHLEGLPVMALVDGNAAGPYTVVGGQIDISADFPDGPPTYVIVGLPYNSDGVMLPLVTDSVEIRSNLKNVYRVSFEVAKARGLSVGPDLSKLKVWQQRQVSDGFNPVAPYTGLEHIRIESTFAHDGSVAFRHSDPLPITLLALGREVNVGGD